MLNDFFTAGNGVLMKQKLESKDLGKYGLMFYNSLFMLGPATVFAWQTGDIEEVLGECHNDNKTNYFRLRQSDAIVSHRLTYISTP